MGCHKLTYLPADRHGRDQETTTPFMGIWKAGAKEKIPFLSGEGLAKKGAAEKKRDYYYPFGMNISALSSTAPLAKPNHYKFNGNEEQLDFNWNIYDFNARMYDPVIGRFSSIDPLAEIAMDLNPYHFTHNNPIGFSDPSGLDEWQEARDNHNRAMGIHEAIIGTGCDPWDPCYKGKNNQFRGNQKRDIGAIVWGSMGTAFKKTGIKLLTFTDANDAWVISYWIYGDAQNIDGTEADDLDKAFASVGVLIPFVSGSALKSVIDAILKRGGLRNALNIADGATDQAHHLIPVGTLSRNEVVQRAVGDGFDFNGAINGIPGAKGFHGKHPAYNLFVIDQLNAFQRTVGAMTGSNARGFIENELLPALKTHINNAEQSGVSLNQYFKNLNGN